MSNWIRKVYYILLLLCYIFVARSLIGYGTIVMTVISNLVLIAGIGGIYIVDRFVIKEPQPIPVHRVTTGNRRSLLVAYGLIIALWFTGQFIFLWYYQKFGDAAYTKLYANEFSNAAVLLWTLVLTIVIAPVTEELLCRYLLFSRIIFPDGREVVGWSKWIRLGLAYTLSVSLFGLIHGTILHQFIVLPLGVLLCFIMYKTNRILYCILGHMLFNSLGLFFNKVIVFYQNSLDQLPVVACAWICYVAVIFAIMALVWKKRF